MAKAKFPATRAVRVLRAHRAVFSLHVYNYEEKGGTALAANALKVDERQVIKTLVMEDANGNPVLVLMHGDREVSTKALARALGVKAFKPCHPQVANRHTGYLVGGISPFGTKKPLGVCVEESILGLEKIYINAGKRGFLAELSPKDLIRILKPIVVNVAI
jgi:Cys-tRNA(Pro) deacylase